MQQFTAVAIAPALAPTCARAWRYLLGMAWSLTLLAQPPTEVATDETLPWQVPAAEWRLLVMPDQEAAHSLLVPVPPAWASAQGVLALGADGLPLPVLPLLAGGRLHAVELHLPGDRLAAMRQIRFKGSLRPPPDSKPGSRQAQQWQQAAQLYLTPTPATGPAPATRGPVLIASRSVRMLARPALGTEYLTYVGKNQPLVERAEQAAFPINAAVLGAIGGEREKIRYQFSTTLLVTETAPLRLALESPRGGAWFLFINHQPVADWVAAGPALAGRMVLPPLPLPPGPHLLQLTGILAEGETLPALVQLLPDGKTQPLPATQLFTPRPALAMASETRQAVLSPGLRAKILNTYAFTQGPVLAQVALRDASRNLFGRDLVARELLLPDSPPIPVETEFTAWLPGPGPTPLRYRVRDQHGYTAELAWAFAIDRTEARTVQVLLEPGEWPLLTPAEGPLVLPWRLTLPDSLDSRILAQGSLRVTWHDQNGRELRRANQPLPAAPMARQLILEAWPPELFRVSLVPTLGEQPLCPPLHLYLLSPTAPPEWRPAAQYLRYRDGFAILRRPAPIAEAKVAKAPLSRPGKLVLVDDLIAAMPHFERDLAPAAYFATLDLPPLLHRPLQDHSLAGVPPILRKFLALPELAKSDATHVVWAIGPSEWAAGLDRRDTEAHWRWLIDATLAAGKTPILVTLPETDQWPPNATRPFALLVKELGVTHGIPVVDYYSHAQRGNGPRASYRLAGEPAHFSATPNAAGRQWYLDLLAETLRDLMPPRSR